jgi:hypothetical protein
VTLAYFCAGPVLLPVSRCPGYWELWARAYGPDAGALTPQALETAKLRIRTHLEACAPCRAWMEAMEHVGAEEDLKFKEVK